jgi:hypothetical protein
VFVFGVMFCGRISHLASQQLCSSVQQATTSTVHRPGDDPRKEFEECGNARGSNVRYYPT